MWPRKRCVVLMEPTNLARYFEHTSRPFTVILFTCLNSHLVSQLIGNMSLDNYIGHLKHTVEGPVVINTSVNATNIGRQ